MLAYPQREFAEALAAALARLRPPDGGSGHLLDAPCGSGETTCWLARHFPRYAVVGSDLDASKIARAQRLFRRDNLRFETADIFDLLRKTPRLDVFCLVNSLFMLPRAEQLLRLAAEKMDSRSLMLCIVSNTDSRNFRAFQRLRPDVNLLKINRSDLEAFFEQQGLLAEQVVGIVFQPFYGLRWLRWLGPLRWPALRWLHGRLSRRPGTVPCYWLVALRKTAAKS
jgi:SAM-dependent methyltransferase